jgi:hypothetical protein
MIPPHKNNPVSPVIVIGMHRSGTSMLLRNLRALGLFVGHTGDNDEAVFFYRIDQWLMSQSGASWENPAPVRYLLENKEVRSLATDYIERYILRSPRVTKFLSWKDCLQYRSLFRLPMAWGWKCPLATFTLPIWLDIFPSAKVIHIYRHGVDVANSLRERALKGLQRTPEQDLYYRLRFLHWRRPKTGGFTEGLRSTSLDGGLSLWEEYLSEARRHVQALGERAMEVKYEELLSDPRPVLLTLAAFCGLPQANADSAARGTNRDRAFAYRLNPELRAFADQVAGRLATYSY